MNNNNNKMNKGISNNNFIFNVELIQSVDKKEINRMTTQYLNMMELLVNPLTDLQTNNVYTEKEALDIISTTIAGNF